MAADKYIPVGRTSMAKQGDKSLQVQTEYAPRPAPRITTTVSHQGQVIHKIERTLSKTIDSPEAQDQVERTLRSQHAEIVGLIQKRGDGTPSPAPAQTDTTIRTVSKTAVRKDPSPEASGIDFATATVIERLEAIPGIKRIYCLDNEGNFLNREDPARFKKAYSVLLKNLSELMELFAWTPGVGLTRVRGVYEVERDRVYFASAGYECYFVIVNRLDADTDYEKAIKAAVSD